MVGRYGSRFVGAAGIFLIVALCAFAYRPAAAEATPSQIPVLEGLRPAINFWKAIFSTYTTKQIVFHDRDDLSRIYSALDFTDLEASGLSDGEIVRRRRAAVDAETERLAALLQNLSTVGPDAPGLTKEERRIARMFPNGSAMILATEEGRIRGQTGLRDRFLRGLEISRRYLPMMERIFRAEGLPVELTRLPFVESAFNVAAYSKVGAAGLWQFMPSTGRLYMTVNDVVDERRDPMSATAAAAKHLKADYESLGTWPLAVSAYNHGRAGMARAVADQGTSDLVQIVREYRGPSFGFASRNFYAEFLAAVEVERDAVRHFGVVGGEHELQVEIAEVPVNAEFGSVARAAGVERDTLAELNPALSSHVLSGRAAVPRGYELRLPPGCRSRFVEQTPMLVATRTMPAKASRRGTPGKASSARLVKHRVRSGQTLSGIARQYQTTVGAIRKHNQLRKSDHVPAGQTLLIPRG